MTQYCAMWDGLNAPVNEPAKPAKHESSKSAKPFSAYHRPLRTSPHGGTR